jgi:hypothetical protein
MSHPIAFISGSVLLECQLSGCVTHVKHDWAVLKDLDFRHIAVAVRLCV